MRVVRSRGLRTIRYPSEFDMLTRPELFLPDMTEAEEQEENTDEPGAADKQDEDNEEPGATEERNEDIEEQGAHEQQDLVAEVAVYDEGLAGEVGDLKARVEHLEDELADTEAELEKTTERLEHTRADFQNYKKRAKRRQEEIKERATEDLIERLLEVRDNLSRALEEESDDVESLREGVKLTRKQFDRVLDAENVERIEPEPGEDVDAQRHEVMMQVESDQPAETIASLYRPGYEMAGKVLRPAQVTVSEGDEDDGETVNDGEAEENSETETDSPEEPEQESDTPQDESAAEAGDAEAAEGDE